MIDLTGKVHKGQEYTLVKFDKQSGYLDVFHFNLEHYTNTPCRNCKPSQLFVVAGDPGALGWRKFLRVYETEQFVLWQGNVAPNTSLEVKTIELVVERGHAVEYKTWPQRDPRFLRRAKQSVKEPPIAEFIEKIKGPEKLETYQCVSGPSNQGE